MELGFEGPDFTGWVFVWTGPNGFNQTNNDIESITIVDISDNETGVYDVAYTDPNGCQNTGTFIVSLYDLAVALGEDVEICNGESTTITATVGEGYCSHLAIPGDPALPDQASHTVSPSATTTYIVTVTDANGCTVTDQQEVVVNDLPEATASFENPICGSTTGSITFVFPDHPTRNIARVQPGWRSQL